MNILVVGAGISGLTCAYRLHQAGHVVRVVEAQTTVGGRMNTVEVDGLHVDTGANLLIANYARLHALAAELDVDGDLMDFVSGSGGILRDDQLTSFTPRNAFEVLRYKGLALPSRVRLLAFFMRAWPWRSTLDFYDLSRGEDPREDVDAFTAVTASLGREVAEYLVDPFIRTFHFHGARRLSMKYFDALAALFVESGGFVTRGFRGFMAQLPRALAAALPDVRTGTRARAITADPQGVTVDGERFDHVVLAIPAPLALQVYRNPTASQRAILEGTQYASTMSVALRVRREAAADFEGIWVPFQESRIISECSNETCKGSFNDTHCVFTVGLHEEAVPELLRASDQRVYQVVMDEWTRLFPSYAGSLGGLHVTRWVHAMPVYAPGHVAAVQRFWAAGQGGQRVWLCGDWLNHPWVEGSIRCGEKVSDLIRAQ